MNPILTYAAGPLKNNKQFIYDIITLLLSINGGNNNNNHRYYHLRTFTVIPLLSLQV